MNVIIIPASHPSLIPSHNQKVLLLPVMGRILCRICMTTHLLPFDAIVGLALITTLPSLPTWSFAASVHQNKYLPHWVAISKVMHLVSMPLTVLWVAVALYATWVAPTVLFLLLVCMTVGRCVVYVRWDGMCESGLHIGHMKGTIAHHIPCAIHTHTIHT